MWTNICNVCGKKYEVCSVCANIKTLNPWRTICDTKEHYQVYIVVKDYNTKIISKSTAKEMLENINFDINTIDEYKKNVQKSLREIFQAQEHKKTNIKTKTVDNK